jgi:2-keto-4-pentenoate hydratase/2-oxohepta-3-ene-1,7-dioic acid hydratase in catechol pathway
MKCICIGRNYAGHARELGNPLPTQPVVFLKPSTACLAPGQPFRIPAFAPDVHYECELVYRVGCRATQVSEAEAWNVLDGVGLGLDFTARTLQEQLKQKGLPWEISKAFDGSAVVSEFLPLGTFPDHGHLRYEFRQNGTLRQVGETHDLIFPVPYLVAFVSRYFTLEPGDVLFTGTPEGVGPVAPTDELTAQLEGHDLLRVHVAG